MRRQFRITVFYILLAALAIAWVASGVLEPAGKQAALDIPVEAAPRTVFLINSDNWTTFRVPATTNRITILSRAQFEDQSVPPDTFLPYNIIYRLVRLDGETITEGILNLRGNYIPMVDSQKNRAPAAFFKDLGTIVSTSRASLLEIESNGILQLQLKLGSFAPSFEKILVRVFQTRAMDQNRPAYLWNRLSPETLVRIGERRVHRLTHISPDEQLNILRNRPVPLGPLGIEGVDYHADTLYIRNDLKPLQRALIEPLGVGEIRCSPNRRAIIGIPQPGGQIRLRVKTPGDAGANNVTIRYFGQSIFEREVFNLPTNPGTTEFSRSLKPGILEIDSPTPATIRAWFDSGNGEGELKLEHHKIKVTRIEAGYPVTFSRSTRIGPSFFKVVARPADKDPITLRYELFDESGSNLSNGTFEVKSIPSLYDFELTPKDERSVNEPCEQIIRLGPEVASVTISCDRPCFVNGFLRPGNLIHHTRVPEDYNRALPDPERLPVWFGLKPDSAEQIVRSHHSHLIQAQPRPPVDNTDILAGRYHWEDFQPENGVGQYLFRERDVDSPVRIEALPSIFARISTGENGKLFPKNLPGLQRPSRRLAYFRDRSTPTKFRMYIDDRLLFERLLVSARGEIALPPFPEDFDSARVHIDAGNIQCYVNYVEPGTATHLKRRAQRVTAGTSSVYLCEKVTSGDELLSGMIYSPTGATSKSHISCHIESTQEGGFLDQSDGFTLRERSWGVTPDMEGRTKLFGGEYSSLDAGQRFFITLGSDMKPGIYRVNITYNEGPGGYLTLSKVLGGDFTDIRFFREISR